MGDARLAAPAQDWLHHRVPLMGPDAADVGDAVLREVVGPAVRRIQAETPGLRWFFLRFQDSAGLHLRLRLHAPLDALARAEEVLENDFHHSGRDHDVGFYSPETAKFGGDHGVEFAEEMFEASSALALATVVAGAPRVTTAAAQLLDLVSGLPPATRPAFLHQYAWYWSGGPAGPVRRDRPPAAQVEALLQRVDNLRAEPDVAAALSRYSDVFEAATRSSRRRVVPRTEPFLRFHHLHLTNNRLGVFPGTEAAVARLLWRATLDGLFEGTR